MCTHISCVRYSNVPLRLLWDISKHWYLLVSVHVLVIVLELTCVCFRMHVYLFCVPGFMCRVVSKVIYYLLLCIFDILRDELQGNVFAADR